MGKKHGCRFKSDDPDVFVESSPEEMNTDSDSQPDSSGDETRPPRRRRRIHKPEIGAISVFTMRIRRIIIARILVMWYSASFFSGVGASRDMGNSAVALATVTKYGGIAVEFQGVTDCREGVCARINVARVNPKRISLLALHLRPYGPHLLSIPHFDPPHQTSPKKPNLAHSIQP